MPLTQDHGCGTDKEKFACLQDKVIATQPVSSSHIPLVMLIIWLDFGGILLETFFC